MHIFLLGLAIESATAATPSAIQNPLQAYTEYCTDPKVTAEMHYERLCEKMRGVVHVSLFDNDQSATVLKRHDYDWTKRSWVTKPYIPMALVAGSGGNVLDLGDVRTFGTAFPEDTMVIAIRVNGKDNVEYCDDLKTKCLSEKSGFTPFRPTATNLTIEGLSGDPVRLEFALFRVTAVTEHGGKSQCSVELDAQTLSYECGSMNLMLIEYRVYEIGPWATTRSTLAPK